MKNSNKKLSILDKLLELMNEQVINEKIDIPLDLAFNSFEFPGKTEITHEEFNLILSEFYLHLNRFRLNIRELSKDEALQEMMWFLERHYGANEAFGYGVSYIVAIHQGVEVIFGRIIEIMKFVEREKYLNWIIASFVDSMDWDAKTCLVNEILEKYGHLFPLDLKRKTIGELVNKLEWVISLVL